MSDPESNAATTSKATSNGGNDNSDNMAIDEVAANNANEAVNGNSKNDGVKTPTQKPLVLSSPPGSSPGMVMRSGRRKRRGASGVGLPTPTPAKAKRSRIRHREDDGGDVVADLNYENNAKADEGTNGDDTHRNHEPMTVDEKDEGAENMSDAPKQDDEKGEEHDQANGHEGSKAEEEVEEVKEEEEEKKDTAEEHIINETETPRPIQNNETTTTAPTPPEVAATSTTTNLITQGLRLPSQHTPKPPKTPAIPSEGSNIPPPSGGRRLLFDSQQAEGRVTVAQQLQQRLVLQQQLQNKSEGVVVLSNNEQKEPNHLPEMDHRRLTSPPSPQRYPLVFEEELTFSKTIKHYTMVWFMVFCFCYVALNGAIMMGVDVRGNDDTHSSYLKVFNFWEQKRMLRSLYGYDVVEHMEVIDADSGVTNDDESPDDTALKKDSSIDEEKEVKEQKEEDNLEEEDDDEPEEIIVEEIQYVEETDPKLLDDAKAKLQTQRKLQQQLEKLDETIAKFREDMEVLTYIRMPPSNPDHNVFHYKNKFHSISASIQNKMNALSKWEEALSKAEKSFDLLMDGGIIPEDVNQALVHLSGVALVPSSAAVLDISKISIPGEGCEGMNYILTEEEEDDALEEIQEEDEEDDEEENEEEEEVVVVGGIDVEALDLASDAPVRYEDAAIAQESLMNLAQSTSDALVGPAESTHTRQWLIQILKEELQKLDLDENPSVELEPIGADTPKMTESSDAYNDIDAVVDIYRVLDTEDADRTGKFDLASVANGARVLHRGPYATSYSLYETLPLFNRVLAYASLRFYGHPPEAALLPTTTMHGRGQCWSFQNEWSNHLSSNRRGITRDGIRGDYATLTVSLASAAFITDVTVEHLPANLSAVESKTAVKDIRVVGFEDAGAFGEPWALGSFQYNLDAPFSLQTFQIPTTIDGLSVPKLKAISLAVDSNWGAEYSCLYRFRVHGA